MTTSLRIAHVISGIQRSSGGPSFTVTGLCQALGRAGCSVDLNTIDHASHQGDLVPVDGSLTRLRMVPCRGKMDMFAVPRGFESMLEESFRDCDVVHTNGLWMPPTACAVGVAARLGKPVVMSFRGMLDPISFRQSRWKKELALRAYAGKAMRSANCYHATAELEEAHLRSFGLRAPIGVVPNGLDTSFFTKYDSQAGKAWLDRRLPELAGKRILLYLSRIHPQKGTEMLLEAWASLQWRFPDWQLIMAGPDCQGHRGHLESWAQRHGCAARVTFMDSLYGDDKALLYASSDVFVLPSPSENFGRVVAEALASGIPAIATTGAPWHELQEHRCGWWIESAVKPLENSLRDAMSLGPQDRAEMGRRGRQLIESTYGWPSIAAQMISMYEWVARGGEPPAHVHFLAGSGAAGRLGRQSPAARSPRIAHVISSIALSAGGPSPAVSGLSEALGKAAWVVELNTVDQSRQQRPSIEINRSLTNLRTVASRGRLDRYLPPSGFKQMLEDSIRQADIVHTHGLWEAVIPCATRMARRLDKPLIMSMHGMLDPLSYERSVWKKRLALLLYMRRSLNSANCYHALAELERDNFRKFGLRGPIAVVPNGLDTSLYLKFDRQTSRQELASAVPQMKDHRILLFLSRIHPQKGTVMLLEAWSRLQQAFRDWHLVIVGPDNLGHRSQLQAQASQGGFDERITFLDAVAGDRKAMLYAASNLFILPSISESFGMVVAEALASGLSVIATTGAPWRQLLEHRCGWWVQAATEPLAEAMHDAMSRPQRELDKAGLRGRELVVAKYGWPAVAAQMLAVYNWLLSGGALPAHVYMEYS